MSCSNFGHSNGKSGTSKNRIDVSCYFSTANAKSTPRHGCSNLQHGMISEYIGDLDHWHVPYESTRSCTSFQIDIHLPGLDKKPSWASFRWSAQYQLCRLQCLVSANLEEFRKTCIMLPDTSSLESKWVLMGLMPLNPWTCIFKTGRLPLAVQRKVPVVTFGLLSLSSYVPRYIVPAGLPKPSLSLVKPQCKAKSAYFILTFPK